MNTLQNVPEFVDFEQLTLERLSSIYGHLLTIIETLHSHEEQLNFLLNKK
jgi:hypothetical protein